MCGDPVILMIEGFSSPGDYIIDIVGLDPSVDEIKGEAEKEVAEKVEDSK
jgi:hypothetical protein